jgi:Uma2 family endonuclease
MAISLPRKLWTVEEYESMIEKGILNKYHHVELIKGEVVNMARIGLRHASCVTNIQALLHESLNNQVATIMVQNPVLLPNESEPQPDVAVVKGHRSLYKERRPTVADLLLLVEVADSTLGTDRAIKVPLYAEAGIPEVWLVNLDKSLVEVYSRPEEGKYSNLSLVRRGETLALPGGLPGVISVDEALG